MVMFRNILVDIDAAAAEHPAFGAACDLAARFDARVTLVDITPDLPHPDDDMIIRHVHQQLADHRREALAALARSRPDVRVSTAVLSGRPAIAIIQQVLRANHDLVVGSHARDLVPGRLYGAVDMQLLRKCPCPVWLIGPGEPPHPPHILAAVDTESDVPGSEELNRTILDLALTIGEARRAEVTVLHVWSLYGEGLLRSHMPAQELHDAVESACRSATEGLRLPDLGVWR